MEEVIFSYYLPPIRKIEDSSGNVLKYANQIPKFSLSLPQVFEMIRKDPTLMSVCEEMNLAQGETYDEVKVAKSNIKTTKLPFVTFGGVFDYRSQHPKVNGKKGLLSVSGLICLDIDSRPKKKEEDYVQLMESEVEDLKKKMSEDPDLGAVLLFRSPSGDGLKVVVSLLRTVRSTDDFKRAYTALEKYILNKYHMITDASRSDIDGACFLSHDPDAILTSGENKFDVDKWSDTGLQTFTVERGGKMEDPTEKDGIIGTFCRAYGIKEAIEAFLPDVYLPERGNRYTYAQGSSKNGVVVYDNKYVCSHHGTDPAGQGREYNSFDLVRIHKFGDLDKTVKVTDITEAPSFKAMIDFIQEDPVFKAKQMSEEFSKTDPESRESNSLLDTWRRTSASVKKSLQEGKNQDAIIALKTQLQKLEASVPVEDPDWLLTPKSEEQLTQEESSLPEGLITGYQFTDQKTGTTTLEIGAGCLTGFVAPTNHGKTLILLNLILNCAKRYPDKKFILLTYEQRENLITQYLLNIYLEDMKLGIDSTNRRVIRGYYQYNRSTKYFDPKQVEEFERRKKLFFKEYIETGRILIKYVDSDCPTLCSHLKFMSKRGLGGVFVDYMQFIPKDPRSRVTSRQEELKQICISLKDIANETGLPIVLACQFNRTVGCCLDLSPTQVGEAGDIERIMSEMYGMWNFGKKETRPLTDKEQHCSEYVSLMKKAYSISGLSSETETINLLFGQKKDAPTIEKNGLLIEVLKARELPTGYQEVLTLYPETGRIIPNNSKESSILFTDWDIPE